MSLSDIIDTISPNNAGPAICELGKIKIGGKAKQIRRSGAGTEWRAPEKYDHFVITGNHRDAAGDLEIDRPLMDQLESKYSDPDGRLRSLPIRVLSDEIEDVLQSAFVWYVGKSVGARSDGKTVTWFCDPDPKNFGKRFETPLEEPWRPEMMEWKTPKGLPLFKLHSVFNCVIAAQEARWGGVYRFRTTSIISFRQLHGSLVHLSQLTGGILIGMPLTLVVHPIQVSPEGKPTTVHVVHVELRGGDMVELQRQALSYSEYRLKFADQIQSTTRQYRKLLSGPGMESQTEAKDIAEEFAPENNLDTSTVPTDAPFGLIDDEPAAPAASPALSATQPSSAPVPQSSPAPITPASSAPSTQPLPAEPAHQSTGLNLGIASAIQSADSPAPVIDPPPELDRQEHQSVDYRPSAYDALVDAINTARTEGREAVLRLLLEAGQHHSPTLKMTDLEKPIGRAAMVHRKKGKEQEISVDLLTSWYLALREGRMDLSTGIVKPCERRPIE